MNWIWELLEVKKAWDVISFNNITKIKIALLDTGCELEHDFFRRSSIECIDLHGKEAKGDEAGYGTYFCGLLLQYLNVEERRKPEIISIKFGSRPRAPISDICRGIDLAIEKRADIINLGSANLNYSSKLANKINEAVERGIIVISHCGNVIVREHTFPASLDNVVSVASIDENCKLAAHSNFNKLINICAPGMGLSGPLTKEQGKKFGVDIDEKGMASTYGTTFAAAAITALAAMVKSENPEIDTYKFMNLIEYTSVKQCNTDTYYSKEKKGIVNFFSCIHSLKDADILHKPRHRYYYWNIKYASEFDVQNQWEADLYNSSGTRVEDISGTVEVELYRLNGLRKETVTTEAFTYTKGKLLWKLNYNIPGNYFIKIKADSENVLSVDIAAKIQPNSKENR